MIAQVRTTGAELIRCDPGDDPSLVLACARRMATEQVGGWIAVRTGDLGQSLCDAGPQDVPLVVVAAPPVSCQSAGVGADDSHAGFLVGEQLGAAPRNRSDCARASVMIFTDSTTGEVNDKRVAGIRAGFDAECPGKVSDATVIDAATQDRAYDAFTTALTGVPEDADVLVASVGDAAALGIAAAIPDDRAGHVTLAAIGADQRARCQIVGTPGWIGDVALFPERYGQTAVPALLEAMQGRPIARALTVPTAFATRASIDASLDAADCPAR